MSKHEELIERLRESSETGVDPGDAYAAADALEAQAREIEGLRKDAEAFRAMVNWGISFDMNMAGRFVTSRREGSRQAWSASIHGNEVHAAARKAVEMAIPSLGGKHD